MDRRATVSAMYQGLAEFLRWRDKFLAEYTRQIAQDAAQVILQQMSPEMLLYLAMAQPENLQYLLELATTEV